MTLNGERIVVPGRQLSPLTGTDFASRPIPEIVNFLQTWQPQPGPQKQTVTALAQQLRQAVVPRLARGPPNQLCGGRSDLGCRPARQVYDLGTGAGVQGSASASSRHNEPEHSRSEVPQAGIRPYLPTYPP
jgi:hypothetical protein